ncbi:MAG: hypothetical protein FD138_4288 [Planctomycetota bacterium]|nr:MAG: hypothetical protein FD138_4288 [Planctomycetota bacterium]
MLLSSDPLAEAKQFQQLVLAAGRFDNLQRGVRFVRRQWTLIEEDHGKTRRHQATCPRSCVPRLSSRLHLKILLASRRIKNGWCEAAFIRAPALPSVLFKQSSSTDGKAEARIPIRSESTINRQCVSPDLAGSDAEQTIILEAKDFASDSAPLKSWDGVDQFAICRHFAERATTAARKPSWTGPAPKFVRLEWE